MESKKSASGPVISGSARKQGIVSRKSRLIFGVVLLSVVSVIAFRQKPHPDSWREVEAGSWDWWTNRLERNAFLREPVVDADIRDIFWLPGSDQVWAVGGDGFILFSPDGGESWQEQESGLEPVEIRNRVSLAVQEDLPGAAPAREAVPILRSVHFVDALHGWAVGDSGTIVSTSDGGATWLRQDAGTNVQLDAVAFVDVDRGWAVGDQGTILKTEDGGRTWLPQNSYATAQLHDVQLQGNPLRGWIVGEYGTILIMEDGGPWRQAAIKEADAPKGAAGLFLGGNLVRAAFEIQRSPEPDLYAVYLSPDGDRGWAVGVLRGVAATLLATNDGGRSWSLQESSSITEVIAAKDELRLDGDRKVGDVYFAEDGRSGWLVSAGFLFRTSDGGRSWSAGSFANGRFVDSVAFSRDGRRGLIGGRQGVLRTSSGGDNWVSSGSPLMSIAISSQGGRVWVGGSDGFLVSDDGGTTWTVREIPDPRRDGVVTPRFVSGGSVHLGENQSGFAVWNGFLLTTRDGGMTWRLSYPASPPPPTDRKSLDELSERALAADFLANGLVGWVLTSEEILLETADGGNTWTARTAPYGSFSSSSASAQIEFLDESTGWVLVALELLATADGGGSWQPLKVPFDISQFQFMKDGLHGWFAGDGIHSTSDGGKTWESQQAGRFYGIHMLPDGRRGWAVGQHGAVFATSDGRRWTPQVSSAKTDLRAVRFLDDGLRGWAVGDGSTILKTIDGGKTWTQPQYRDWSAPWYYLSCALILFVIVVPAMRQPTPAEEPSVADVLASDRPIGRGDPDPLEFGRIAGGASRFLANEKTEPPLTLAVKGEWGTGKSSLMNLIRDDLKDYGFPTVWFNAWHYQTEEHLLGSLMENIQRQAIPAWWTPVGLAFRVRLLYLRGAKHWLPTALLLFLFAGLLHYVTQDWSRVESLQATLTELAKIDLAKLSDQWGSVLALLATIFGPLLAIQRGTRTFASTTSGFLATLFGAFRVDGLEGDVGFREQFAATFRDVTRALQPRRLTIFIDDLDRCQPDKTVRVLELINFLVVSGDCFVVVGMAPDWVIRSVGLGFKDVAAEMIEEPAREEGTGPRLVKTDDKPLDGPDRAKKIRQEFARNYLEKLINIEVPLPRPSGEAVAELLTPPEPPVHVGWERLRRQAVGLVQSYAPMLALAALVGIGYWQGPHLLMGPSSDGAATTPSVDTPLAPTPQVAPRGGNANVGVAEPGAPEPSRPAIFIPGQTHSPPWWPAAAGILAVLVLGAFRLALGPKRLEKDSPAFRRALGDWYPLVYHDRATPRSVKRFLNRVRYYAMRQRGRRERISAWRSLYGAIRGRLGPPSEEEVDPSSTRWIPEDVLVALSAIQEAYPDAIASGEVRDFATFLEEHKDLPDAMTTRLDTLKAYPSPAPFLDYFQRMSEGVDIRR